MMNSSPTDAVCRDIDAAREELIELCGQLVAAASVNPPGRTVEVAEVVRAYVNDPLVFTGKTTARLGAETIDAMARVQAQAGTLRLPLLILQGGADRLVDPAGAEQLYQAAGSADKTLKVYPGLYHEIYNEPEHEQVLRDVELWFEAHL